MKTLMSAAVLLAAFFQAPANPPMKMGLWESRGTDKVRQPDGRDKVAKSRSSKLRYPAELAHRDGADC